MTTENKSPLGMLFPKVNSKSGKTFLSGYVEINGTKTQIIANKATKPDKNGKPFYVIFENDQQNELVPAVVNKAKATLVKKTKGSAGDDESSPF